MSQSNAGGNTYCPLENDARILICSTPQFAKAISSKLVTNGFGSCSAGFGRESRAVHFTNSIQDISRSVGELAESTVSQWKDTPSVEASEVSSIGISLDGTCMLLREDGWRQAMVSSISLDNAERERLHTVYTAQASKYGKETF